jgi:geranylgeranyl diphosphate synthase type II
VNDFPSYLATLRGPVDETLDLLLPSPEDAPKRLHEAMRYAVFAGGKRVRPALVLITGEALDTPQKDLLAGGAALEMIHTYSLVHDDLPAMDDDDLRRGRPTLHKAFDEALAILAGDGLLTLGMTVLAMQPKSASAEARCRAAWLVGEAIGSHGMIGGQVDDMAAEDHWGDNAAALLESIHRRKTGALLTACVRLAGVYSGASEDDDALLTEIGDAIGLLFQIGDDILDVEGSSSTLGKTAGKDAAVKKLTYPGLYGLEESKTMLRRTRDQALDLVRRLPREGYFPSLVHYLTTRDR